MRLFRILGFRGKFRILNEFDEKNPPLGHIDGLLEAEIFQIGTSVSYLSLSDPIYYPYLQIWTFAFSVGLHIFESNFDYDFHGGDGSKPKRGTNSIELVYM